MDTIPVAKMTETRVREFDQIDRPDSQPAQNTQHTQEKPCTTLLQVQRIIYEKKAPIYRYR